MMRFSTASKIGLALLVAFFALALPALPVLADSDDFDKGIHLFSNSDFANALPCFDHSVDAEPTNGKFHFWRAKCLAELDRGKEACAEYKLASMLSSDPNMREDCKNELARYNVEAPKQSVSDLDKKSNSNKDGAGANTGEPADEEGQVKNNEKLFKLSSKKLDWNLQVSDGFLQQVKERTAQLDGSAQGRPWRINAGAAARQPMNPETLKAALSNGPAHFTAQLDAAEMKQLKNSDIVLILDHSGSMRATDCPSVSSIPEPRISWCAEEMESFADSLCNALPHGFHFITFDTHPDIYTINSSNQLRTILQSLTAGGGTNLSIALEEAFRLHTAHPNQPMLIAVITDAEIEVKSCERSIVDATRRFPLPNGVFITLLQVGVLAEANTADRINYLDDLKNRAGAAYNAFYGVPFSRVRREGLGRDLLLGIKENGFMSLRSAGSSPAGSSTQMTPCGSTAAPSATTQAGASANKTQKKSSATAAKNASPVLPSKPAEMPVMWPVGGK